jgi:hypothetical protein
MQNCAVDKRLEVEVGGHADVVQECRLPARAEASARL